MATHQTKRAEPVITEIGPISNFGTYVRLVLMSAGREWPIAMTPGAYEELVRQMVLAGPVPARKH